MLTVSIYDTKRNSKSKEHREAMVSLAPCPRAWLPLGQPGLQADEEDWGFCQEAFTVILAAELTISMLLPREHSGPRPGLPHLQELWPRGKNENCVPTSTWGSP